MPKKIIPDLKAAAGLSPAKYQNYQRLEALAEKINKSTTSQANQQDAIRLVETLKYILVNDTLIRARFSNPPGDVFDNERDKEHGVLRDHVGTSFHLNSYDSAEEALSNLNTITDDFLAAAEYSEQQGVLNLFVSACEYNAAIGCLEARIGKALTFAAQLQSNPILPVDNLFHMIFQACPDKAGEAFEQYLERIKKECTKHMNRVCIQEDKPCTFTWPLIKDYLKTFWGIEADSKDAQDLDQAFSDIALYFDYLRNSNVRLVRGQQGMLQHRFKTPNIRC